MYKRRPDGSCEKLLAKENDDIVSFCIFENTVFYLIEESLIGSIHKININGSNKESLNIEFKFDITLSLGLTLRGGQLMFCNKK